MIRPHRTLTGRAMLLVAALSLTLPTPGWTWGSGTHHYIAQNYSKHLPPYMDGLRVFDATVNALVTDADSRKPSHPEEGVRHYIDIDYYPEFLAGTLTHDRAALAAEYTDAVVWDTGVLPWAVDTVMTRLAQQFQAQDWNAAAVTIADLCHYVGDATQPLHCTQNFDGQYTGNNGVHSRYETTMMNAHLGELYTEPMPVVYYANSVDEMFDIITNSWADVSPLLQADTDAKSASGGFYNSTYYASLWANTQGFTRTQVDRATVATASFVFTAWLNAGSPPIPGSSAGVPVTTVAGARLEASPTPFRNALSIRFAGQGPLSVDVYDVRGTRVDRIVDRAPAGGSVSWRPSARIQPGVYFIRLTGAKSEIVRRVARLQ